MPCSCSNDFFLFDCQFLRLMRFIGTGISSSGRLYVSSLLFFSLELSRLSLFTATAAAVNSFYYCFCFHTSRVNFICSCLALKPVLEQEAASLFPLHYFLLLTHQNAVQTSHPPKRRPNKSPYFEHVHDGFENSITTGPET